MPRMHSVTIINDNAEPVELHSVSESSTEFYSSVFEHTTVAGDGGNTTVHIYYLPRSVGRTRSIFTIESNHGQHQYHVEQRTRSSVRSLGCSLSLFQVQGTGIANPFRVYPLVNAIVPLNSTFEHVLHFYNPYNHSLYINEIYTSDENLIIELLASKHSRTKISKGFEHHEQWHLKPYEMKPIVKMNYIAHKLGRLHGFICIKSNVNHTIVLPVEILASNRLGLYSFADTLTFTPERFVRSMAATITIPIYVINNGLDTVQITVGHISIGMRHNLVTNSSSRRQTPIDMLPTQYTCVASPLPM
jgi:hypothetical protein